MPRAPIDYNPNNVFQKIIAGKEDPSGEWILEKEESKKKDALSFYSGRNTPLVIPTGKFRNFQTFTELAGCDEITNLLKTISEVSEKLNLEKKNIRLTANNKVNIDDKNNNAVQSVDHLHFRIESKKNESTNPRSKSTNFEKYSNDCLVSHFAQEGLHQFLAAPNKKYSFEEFTRADKTEVEGFFRSLSSFIKENSKPSGSLSGGYRVTIDYDKKPFCVHIMGGANLGDPMRPSHIPQFAPFEESLNNLHRADHSSFVNKDFERDDSLIYKRSSIPPRLPNKDREELIPERNSGEGVAVDNPNNAKLVTPKSKEKKDFKPFQDRSLGSTSKPIRASTSTSSRQEIGKNIRKEFVEINTSTKYENKESEFLERTINIEEDRLKKYGGEVSEKTKKLIKLADEKQDEVFYNKLVRALDNLRKFPKNDGNDEEKTWKSLTTLDRRVLAEYYSKNHEPPINFLSLYKEAKNDKSELRIDNQDYIFDSSKINEIKEIMGYAAQAIPKTTIRNPVIKQLCNTSNSRF